MGQLYFVRLKNVVSRVRVRHTTMQSCASDRTARNEC